MKFTCVSVNETAAAPSPFPRAEDSRAEDNVRSNAVTMLLEGSR